MNELSDRELVQKSAAGSPEAFDELIRRFRDRLVSFAYRLSGDRDAAEDLAQETLLRAYRAVDRYDGRAEVSTWLFTIARNLCLNARRDRARHYAAPLLAGEDAASAAPVDRSADSPDDALSRTELAQAIEKAISHLPERQRSALLLARYEQMPYEQIAEVLHCSVAAVKLCVFRARQSLKESLRPYLEG